MKLRWFATHIDRDFQYGCYGNGKPRMYVSNDVYTYITPLDYKDGALTVKDEWGDIFNLTTEPDNEWFRNSVYQEWLKFDAKMIGDEDRSDYEPWAYNSIESIAYKFGFIENQVKMFYSKEF